MNTRRKAGGRRMARAGNLVRQHSGKAPVVGRALVAAALAVGVLVVAMPQAHAATAHPAEAIATISTRANYAPCSTITWAYDPAGEPPDVSNLSEDIGAALRLLGARTGLAFIVAAPGTVPDILYGWDDLAEYEPGTQAVAWRSGVTFALDSEVTRDRWSGFWRRAVPVGDGSQDIGIGRGWLIVHETMHSLGFAHSDERGSVMAPLVTITNVATRADARRELRAGPKTGFSPGDIAAMDELYPTGGCLRT